MLAIVDLGGSRGHGMDYEPGSVTVGFIFDGTRQVITKSQDALLFCDKSGVKLIRRLNAKKAESIDRELRSCDLKTRQNEIDDLIKAQP